ncbi:XVIPCD domain-containing protein [Lysobacter capsici]|uniref:XVIPCD domain-containing protein n=1 Tax=Lysobacter capsici TaxID=435897 RepID=UPI0009E2911C|nr:XVIPCD domain-containing protein [Lysobacter capsici]
MTDREVHDALVQPKGDPYAAKDIIARSHYNDPIDQTPGRPAGNSRIWGDASPEVQSEAIDALIAASEKAGLTPRQTAHVLAIARAESGFNPDAAAGTTTAMGLGQFVDKTGAGYGINDGNRGDLSKQAEALVDHYLDNAALAKRRGQNEDYVYKYHHDGPADDYGGLGIGREKVNPYIDRYEDFVREHQHKRGFKAPEEPAERTALPRGGSGNSSRDALADGVLRQGERGPEVRELQERLNELGYTDAHGRPLRADGKFGQKTEEALEAFQRDHDLKVDGVAGSRTLDALKAADPAKPRQEGTSPPVSTNGPLLSDPTHPDHDLYKQALKGIEKLGPEAGFKDQAERERAAATLTYEAKVSGMSKIDHVVPNASGTGLFAVQGAVNDPAHQRVYADKTQAAQQPVDKTTEQLSQDAPRQNNAPSQANQDQVKSMTV